MEKQQGIILKKYAAHANKCIVLDSKLGKIVCVSEKATLLSVGAVIRYVVTTRNQLCFINHVELLELPLMMAKDDILFLHHILEMCNYFSPLSNYADDIFNHVIAVYNLPHNVSLIAKKSFLFKFYIMLGLYAQESNADHAFFTRLAHESVDTIAQKILDLGFEKKLTDWLYSCIAVHPHARYFKTIHFLEKEKLGDYEKHS